MSRFADYARIRRCKVCREETPVQAYRVNQGVCTACARSLRHGEITPALPRQYKDRHPEAEALEQALANMREIEYNEGDEATDPLPTPADPQLRPARVPAVRRGVRPTRRQPPGDG